MIGVDVLVGLVVLDTSVIIRKLSHIAYCYNYISLSSRNAGFTLMKSIASLVRWMAVTCCFLASLQAPSHAQQSKPNILVIWGDDIGQFNVSLQPRDDGL